jgi:radical SAM-linked protein
MVRDKVRIRFRKDGDLRWISHHDLLRGFERLLRRADIPFHVTSGFNPKPRLIFALSLPLGVVGCDETADLELTESLPVDELQQRLAAQAPAGLSILSVERIPWKATARVERVCYSVPIPPSQLAGLPERIEALLAAPFCWIQRQRPRPRQIDLRPYICDLQPTPDSLEMELRVTPQGTARPDEILDLLGLGGLREAGAIVRRTRQEIEPENLEEQDSHVPASSAEADGNYQPAPKEDRPPEGDEDAF